MLRIPGTTPDMAVNVLHYDLIATGETHTMLKSRLLALVEAGAAAGDLDLSKLKQRWAINAARRQ